MAVKVKYYQNPDGPLLGSVSAPVIEKDGLFFKDLAGTGDLLPYEDWRLDPKERAKDLASRLSIEEIAGLMLYSSHQSVPPMPGGPFGGTYGGKPLAESGAAETDLTDQQKVFLERDHVRYVLAAAIKDAYTAAGWNNEMQAFVEKLPFGIPVNTSTDPRNGASSAGAEYKSGGGQASKWPEGLGIAATFDPELCEKYAQVISREYRAMGLTTALSPQVDLGTEPRWMRVEDTFGACPQLVTDMSRAYCDGMQTDASSSTGWGLGSVAAMAKHWPGGGPCEAGRDAHYAFGKFAVHPGGCADEHLKPFLNGAFRLNGPTGQTASVMPYYAITCDMHPDGISEGNSYSKYIIGDLLREKYGFDGVVCTDWGITGDPKPEMDSFFAGRCFGAEELTEAERHFKIIENGVDQFGGNNNIAPVLEAYRIGCEKYGEEAMRARFERSAVRLLTNTFRCGLFENPYLEPGQSQQIVGCEEHCAAGFEAQLRSVVMVKNNGALPVSGRKKVYVPGRSIGERKGFFRNVIPPCEVPGADRAALEKYFDWAETPQDADMAVVFIESPISDGYSSEKGYLPISLQYRPYTADKARRHSIGQGDIREKDNPDRSYFGKTNIAANEKDLDIVLETRAAMPDKPVIVVVRMHNPCVLAELEQAADAILIDFGVQQDALMKLITGEAEPSGLLPVQLPADMETVEAHCEDKPLDMTPYTDSCGNAYDFGFGLNWRGRISDERTQKYLI